MATSPTPPSGSEARSEILRRILAAKGTSSDAASAAAAWDAIDRGYKQTASIDRHELLHQLQDRLLDYDAGVYRVAPAGLPELIGTILLERHKHKLAIPDGLPVEWLPAGFDYAIDTRASHAEIDACEGVITSATLAIAETGTIVLQDVPGEGRRAITLLPDYHLCVVDAARVIQTVPEAIAHLAATAQLATTFFSGPSATADIEMTRIKGVHGPRFVDVILLVHDAPQD